MSWVHIGKAPLPAGLKIFNFEIRFYALFILTGAILAYVLARRYLKKAGFSLDFAEGVFYTAFPAGIVGARIWYVIASWNSEFAGQPFWKVFAIWEGGLAIQGGVILGVAVGMLYVMLKKPHYNVLKIAGLIVPTILLAQAIGRFGNFFNCEVYGFQVESKWILLPNILKEQLRYNNFGQLVCEEGFCHLPLFLIEGLINTAGFFIIMYAIRLPLKKWLKPGDLIGCYFIWYGIVRAVLEPLRNASFQMGKNLTSVWMAVLFVIIGAAVIVLSHVFAPKLDAYYARKTKEYEQSLVLETAETKKSDKDEK